MSTTIGKPVIFGAATVSFTYAAQPVDVFITSVEVQGQSDREEIRDSDNDVASVVFSNRNQTARVNLIPAGTTAVPVLSSLVSGAELVTIVSTQVSAIAGTWVALSSTVNLVSNGAATVSLELARYLVNSVP